VAPQHGAALLSYASLIASDRLRRALLTTGCSAAVHACADLFAKTRLDFHFNSDGDEALISENMCLLDTGLCTALTGAAYFRTLMMHKHRDGYWDRSTYFNTAGYSSPTFLGRVSGFFASPPVWAASKTPRCGGTIFPHLPLINGDGYRLAPVLLPGRKVNKVNIKKAAAVAPVLMLRKSWRGSVLP